MTNCNLTTCRYNENGKCANEEKRKECVEASRKVLCSDVTKDVPVKARQIGRYYFEVTMLDGSVRKFYCGNIEMHYVIPRDPNPKLTFNLIEI